MATDLTTRNTQQQLDKLANPEKDFIPEVAPNRMQLYSYYKPGLEARNYTIEAVQTIKSQSYQPGLDKNGVWPIQTKRVFNTAPGASQDDPKTKVVAQQFEVMAPQFSIEPALINSFYPPEGHQDEGRILPHLVLNDPHFPWERDAGRSDAVAGLRDPDLLSDRKTKTSEDKPVFRSKVPWIALLVFDPSELKLTADQAEALKIPTFSGPEKKDVAHAPANGAFLTTVEQYLGMKPEQRVNFEAGLANDPDELTELKAATEAMQAIFPSKSTFRSLFPDAQKIEANKYLAHVRAVNTIGFPDAGVEQVGNYSIMISGRTAELSIIKPTTQICHLISIEHVDSTIDAVNSAIKADPKVGDERIGLVSLFSWTYTALPPNPVNFVDTIEKVVDRMQTLRAPEKALDALQVGWTDPDGKPIAKPTAKQNTALKLYQRLSAGYTIARWRCETGEETAAFNRGPLVPQRVAHPPVSDWPTSSNNSKQYHILDKTTGLMDLSYSSAWQLGKLLAISDTGFNAALMRFRSLVYDWAVDQARKDKDSMTSKEDLIMGLANSLKIVAKVATNKDAVPRRVIPTNAKVLQPNAANDPQMKPAVADNIKTFVKLLSSAGDQIWDEWSLVEPKNDDWAVISTWITQKLSLCDIPAHILIPDPSYLPEESLRFFHIDDTWMDCMLDGALSVANHLDRDDDLIRSYIKDVYNTYLDHEIKGPDKNGKIVSTGIKPQIPCYGFLLRSQIVKVMPDLRITVKWWPQPPQGQEDPDKRSSVCRYTKLDEITILCLLDRQPEELDSIMLAQPPHQQRFSLGYALFQDETPEKSYLGFRLRQLYTKGAPEDKEWPEVPPTHRPGIVTPRDGIKWPTDPDRKDIGNVLSDGKWYDWTSRMIQAEKLAKDINIQLELSAGNQEYHDYVPNSAELAMELNDPSYYFSIMPHIDPSKPRVKTPRNRRIWTTRRDPMKAPDKDAEDTTASDPLGKDSEPKGVPQQPGDATKVDSNQNPTIFAGSNGVARTGQPPIRPANPTQPLPLNTTPRMCFTLSIFADYKGPPKSNNDPSSYIPTKTPNLYDLIFNIRKIPSVADIKQTLQEIVVYIPHTGLSSTPDGQKAKIEPLLYNTYADPRARMVSNQRFVVFINNTTTHVQVRVIPRGATSFPSNDKQRPSTITISDKRSTELSFRLAETDVPPVQFPKGLPAFGGLGGVIVVQMIERYVLPSGQVYNVQNAQGWSVAKLDRDQ